MSTLTSYIADFVDKEIKGQTKIALKKNDSYYPTLLWSVHHTGEEKGKNCEMEVRWRETGPISVRFSTVILVISSSNKEDDWTMFSADFWEKDVDDLDIVLRPVENRFSFYSEKRFSKKDFLQLWPHLRSSVDIAHEVALVFRIAFFNYMRMQAE